MEDTTTRTHNSLESGLRCCGQRLPALRKLLRCKVQGHSKRSQWNMGEHYREHFRLIMHFIFESIFSHCAFRNVLLLPNISATPVAFSFTIPQRLITHSFKELGLRTEEVAWQLPVVATFPEDLGLIPITHMTAHNHVQLQFQE